MNAGDLLLVLLCAVLFGAGIAYATACGRI